jgi:hypothetical protein
MDDQPHRDKHLGPFANLRGDHLGNLKPIEDKARELAPLPISYDIARVQPPWFSEFMYSEMLGGMMVAPQSSEIAARMLQYELDNPTSSTYNVVPEIFNRQKLDKYKLDDAVSKPNATKIIFPPGSNIVRECLSRDTVSHAMFDDKSIVIKPHPMSLDETLRDFGLAFGYDRVIPPKESGMKYLLNAEEVWVTTATEIGLYAILLGKPIHNATVYAFESRGAYSHFYRFLWKLSIDDRNKTLTQLLNSPYSGFFHPNDPNYEEKMKIYFEKVMELRYVPIMPELSIGEYVTAMTMKTKGLNPVPQGQPK